jgi:O-methyltransferase involved in polyketide biosynthesis
MPLYVTVELDMKFVPLMVRVCTAAPAVTEEGERVVILGTGFDGGGEELPPPPLPPQDAKTPELSATKTEKTNRRVGFVPARRLCLSSDMVI